MCCGDYEGLEAAIAAPAGEGVMAKVFTTVPGLSRQIGSYGPASNDVPAIVPEDVATELAGDPEFKVERDAAPKPAVKTPAPKTPEKGEERS